MTTTKNKTFLVKKALKRVKMLLLSHSQSRLISSKLSLPPPIYSRISLSPLDCSQVHQHQEIYSLSHQQQSVCLANLPPIRLLQTLTPICLQQAKVQVFSAEVNLPQNRYSAMQPLLSPKNKMKRMSKEKKME